MAQRSSERLSTVTHSKAPPSRHRDRFGEEWLFDEDGREWLDAYGGHTGVTIDSPSSAVYHYHVNEQTSTNAQSAGQKQWFLTAGKFRGTPAACGSCN